MEALPEMLPAGYGYGNSYSYDSNGCYRTYSSRRHGYVVVCNY
jgi:hypothetical protein